MRHSPALVCFNAPGAGRDHPLAGDDAPKGFHRTKHATHSQGVSSMAKFEYHVIKTARGGQLGNLNERIQALVDEGWDPIMMSGDEGLNIMLRRPVPQPAQQPQAQQAQRPAQPQQAQRPATPQPPQ